MEQVVFGTWTQTFSDRGTQVLSTLSVHTSSLDVLYFIVPYLETLTQSLIKEVSESNLDP